MALEITNRSEKGSPLLPAEMDAILEALAALANANAAKLAVVLNPDGTLKDGAVGATATIADGIITLAKMKALDTKPAIIIVDAAGDWTVLTGTENQVILFNAAGLPTAVDRSALIQAEARQWLASGALSRAVDASASQAAWQALNLATLITALGATGATSVLVRVECFIAEAASGANAADDMEVLIRVTNSNAVSTTSEDTPHCRARARADDDLVDGGANNIVDVNSDTFEIPITDGTSIYWNALFTQAPAGSYARLWVLGFRKL